MVHPASAARRAEALRELAQLLESGLDANRALATLQRDGPEVRRGRPAGLVDGLRAAGLLDAREAVFVRALEAAGRVEAGLVQVAADLDRFARMERRVRRHLVGPLGVLVLAAFVVPAPDLARGVIDAGGYGLAVARVLVPVGVLLWLLRRHGAYLLARWQSLRAALGGPPSLVQRRRLFAATGRMLESGLDAAATLEALAGAEAPALRARLESAGARARAGAGFVEALREHGLLAPGHDAGIVGAGEGAGRLAETLRHRADQLGERLERRVELVAEWLPRAFYALIVVWMASHILGG